MLVLSLLACNNSYLKLEANKDNLKLRAQLFSDDGEESFNYEFDGPIKEALNIGETVGKQLLSLAGNKFNKK